MKTLTLRQHHLYRNLFGFGELFSGHFWLSVLSECLSCYIYVFIVCSTRISWTGAIIGHEPNLLAMSLTSGIAMMLLLITFRSVHVNPALTISFLITGRIPLIRAIIYILVHCMSSIAAIAFLYSISIKGHAGALGLDNPHSELSVWQILIIEAVISFLVTIITFAASNHSSYKCAKKFTLQQLGQTPSLFSPNSCDKTTLASFNSRRSIAPVVPHVPSTSITLLNTYNPPVNAGNCGFHLMNNNNSNNHSPRDCALTMPANNNNLNSRGLLQHATTLNVNNNNNNINNNNNNNNNNGIISDHNNMLNHKSSLLATYSNEYSSNYEHEYEYDFGHQYGTQANNYDNHNDDLNHVPSNLNDNNNIMEANSPQISIEQVMEEETNLLAPNGFPIHLTKAHAFVIGLAYFVTSLSGIPASGASLNPARSFGPAFIMNHWNGHWIYWIGPIVGAVVAGFFYEFIFNPTKRHSLCYRPKFFQLSALDMAKVGLKSRFYQQQQQQHQYQQQRQHKQQHLYSIQQQNQHLQYQPQPQLQQNNHQLQPSFLQNSNNNMTNGLNNLYNNNHARHYQSNSKENQHQQNSLFRANRAAGLELAELDQVHYDVPICELEPLSEPVTSLRSTTIGQHNFAHEAASSFAPLS